MPKNVTGQMSRFIVMNGDTRDQMIRIVAKVRKDTGFHVQISAIVAKMVEREAKRLGVA